MFGVLIICIIVIPLVALILCGVFSLLFWLIEEFETDFIKYHPVTGTLRWFRLKMLAKQISKLSNGKDVFVSRCVEVSKKDGNPSVYINNKPLTREIVTHFDLYNVYRLIEDLKEIRLSLYKGYKDAKNIQLYL